MKHHEGLIVTSGCPGSVVNANLMYDRYGEARQLCAFMKELFGEDFFMEIMYHGLQIEKQIIPDQLKISKELDIPAICTNDTHYIDQAHAASHDIFLCMSMRKCMADPKRLKFPYKEFYLKSAEEMGKIFGDTPECMWNTKELADRIDIDDIAKNLFGGMRLPNFPIPREHHTPLDYLDKLAWEGLADLGWDKSPDHVAALKKELRDVKVAWDSNGYDFATYFLIERDVIRQAKKENVIVGCGRGCLGRDSLVPVNGNSLKTINDVVVGDKVLTRNGEFKNVLEVHKYDLCDKEKLIKVKTYYGDHQGVSMTSDHKVLVEKFEHVDNYETWANSTRKSRKIYKEPSGNLVWSRSDSLRINDWLFIPFPKFDIVDKDEFDLADHMDEHFVLHDDSIEEFTYTPNSEHKRHIKTIDRFIKINSDFMWILGKFVADGWLRSGPSYKNVIGFAFNKNEISQIKFVKKYFESIGADVKQYDHKTKQLVQLDVKSKCLCSLFSLLMNKYEFNSHTKHVPEFVFNLPNDKIMFFIQGAFAGDGYTVESNRKYTYGTVSINLAYQLRTLLLLCKIPSSCLFEGKDNNDRNGFVLNCPKFNSISAGSDKPCLNYDNNFEDIVSKLKNVKYLDNGMLVKIRSISHSENDKHVYDITVDGESNYFANSFIVHNSGFASVLLRTLGIAYGPDPLKYGLWERFLGFDDKQFIKESDFGIEDVLDLDHLEYMEEDEELVTDE